jgi:thiol-disulfide isomerase/thioredoxin
MKVYKIEIFLILFFFIVSCVSKKTLVSQLVTKDDLEILYGEINKEQLFFDFPDWKNIYSSYEVKHTTMDSLKHVNTNLFDIDIYLGTWCGDSKKVVPRFLKILNETKLITENRIRLFAVDRKKKLNNGLAAKNNIQRVATFIIKKQSSEIGRIVEYPEKSLESDLVKILSKHQ